MLAKNKKLWDEIIAVRRWFLLPAIGCYCMLVSIQQNWMTYHHDILIEHLIIQTVVYTNVWLWLMTIIGYGGAYLNFSNRILDYCNQAILPIYILHQTVTIILAKQLSMFDLVLGIEVVLLIVLTIVTCLGVFELVKRIHCLRFAFGLKIHSKSS
ncbi:MAG: hypothetical protein AAGB12_13515 [Pseudomonadota bacterium]